MFDSYEEEYDQYLNDMYDQFLDDILNENQDSNNEAAVAIIIDLSNVIDDDLPF